MSVTIIDGWIKEAVGMNWVPDSFGPFQAPYPRWIVIHGTAWPGGTAEIIGQSWQGAAASGHLGAATHLIVNKDGTYVQGVPLTYTAAGNCCLTDNPYNGGQYARWLPPGNQNYYTISIEHCKDDSQYNSDALTPAQQASSFQIIKAICETYGVPKQVENARDPSKGGIIGHRTIDAKNRWYCPGAYPWKALQAYLDAGGDVNIFIGEHANDTRVQLWRSFSIGIGRTPPPEGTGFFESWIDKLNNGICMGSPRGPEFPLTLADGSQKMAQDIGGNIVIWHDDSKTAEWL